MRRTIFALLCAGVPFLPARAQQVPGRELLEFPLGFGAEPPALAAQVGGGLRNPAAMRLPAAARYQIAVAALSTPIQQGVAAQYLSVSTRFRRGWTGSVSLARAQLTDLLRTEFEPNTSIEPSSDDEIPYSTTLVSAGIARDWGVLTLGGAVRYRRGVADLDRAGATSVDAGAIADRPFGVPLRVALSTFLLSPSGGERERVTFAAAIESPIVRDSTRELGAGYSLTSTDGYGKEHYPYAWGRWRKLDARAGLARHDGFVGSTNRLRVGLGLQYARYTIGLAREDSGVSFGAAYQFTVTAAFK